MLSGGEPSLVEAEGSIAVWHCAIHGTRTRCAFVYMRCDCNDVPGCHDRNPALFLSVQRERALEKGKYGQRRD